MGTEVILRWPHTWHGYTGTITPDDGTGLPGAVYVVLHEIGRRVGVIELEHLRVLPRAECRSS